MVSSEVVSAAATMFVMSASSSSGTFVPFVPLFIALLLGSSRSGAPSIRILRLNLWRNLSLGNFAFSFVRPEPGPGLVKVGMLLQEALLNIVIFATAAGA